MALLQAEPVTLNEVKVVLPVYCQECLAGEEKGVQLIVDAHRSLQQLVAWSQRDDVMLRWISVPMDGRCSLRVVRVMNLSIMGSLGKILPMALLVEISLRLLLRI